MPLMTLASTAIDQVLVNREEVIQNCLKYLPTDSALYFTDEVDRILLAKQRKYLSPAIRYLNRHLLVNLEPTTAVASKIQHDADTVAKFRAVLERMVRCQQPLPPLPLNPPRNLSLVCRITSVSPARRVW